MRDKITDYLLVETEHSDEMCVIVNKLVRDGWVPFGPATCTGIGTVEFETWCHTQTLVKYAKPQPTTYYDEER